MTKQIQDWRLKLILWLEKRREKEKQREIKNIKESIVFNLTSSLTTEESLEVFENVKIEYNKLMEERLVKVNREKSVLEQFLSVS